MEEAKDTRKQDKQRTAISAAGGIGGLLVWGGVAAAIGTSLLLASVSAMKSRKKRCNKDSGNVDESSEEAESKGKKADLLDPSPTVTNCCNQRCKPSTEDDMLAIEIMGKKSEDKEDDKNCAINDEKGGNDEQAKTDHVTQMNQLADDQVSPPETKTEEEDEAITVVPSTPQVLEDKNVNDDDVVEKKEELAEEIELDTWMALGGENEEDSDENSVDEDEAHDLEKGAEMALMAKEKEAECDGNENAEREVQEMDTIHSMNGTTKGELKIVETVEEDESVEIEATDKEGEQEYGNGESMVEIEKESSEMSGDEEEDSSEGAGDSSMESNIDAIWPAEATEDMSTELDQLKTKNEKPEESSSYSTMETGERDIQSSKNDSTDVGIYEDSGKSTFKPGKRNLKELLLDPPNIRLLVWSVLVSMLALAAPLVLSPGDIMKLSIIILSVVILARVMVSIM